MFFLYCLKLWQHKSLFLYLLWIMKMKSQVNFYYDPFVFDWVERSRVRAANLLPAPVAAPTPGCPSAPKHGHDLVVVQSLSYIKHHFTTVVPRGVLTGRTSRGTTVECRSPAKVLGELWTAAVFWSGQQPGHKGLKRVTWQNFGRFNTDLAKAVWMSCSGCGLACRGGETRGLRRGAK